MKKDIKTLAGQITLADAADAADADLSNAKQSDGSFDQLIVKEILIVQRSFSQTQADEFIKYQKTVWLSLFFVWSLFFISFKNSVVSEMPI